jgi:hypothetical protein
MDAETVKEIREELKIIRESQIKTEADLAYHIRRTDGLEKLLSVHEAKMERQSDAMSVKIGRIETPYKVSLFVLSALGLITVVMQIIAAMK